MTRRRALTLLAAGLCASRAVAAQPALALQDEIAALRRAAQSPGPARAKLAAITPRHTARPLPFRTHDIPGFSRDTHFVHFERHYLEYLWRWEDTERALLRACAGGEPPANFSAQNGYLLQSANMVLLHELYWSRLGTELQPASDDRTQLAAALSALIARRGERAPLVAWIVLLEAPGAAPFIALFEGTDAMHTGAARVVDGIDCAAHAWALDFPTVDDYLMNLVRLWDSELVERWTLAARQKARDVPPRDAGAEATEEDALPLLAEVLKGAGVDATPRLVLQAFRKAAGADGCVEIHPAQGGAWPRPADIVVATPGTEGVLLHSSRPLRLKGSV